MKDKRVLYELPGMDAVPVRQVVADGVTIDFYGQSRAAVVLVAGYPDAGFAKHVGCSFREMGSTVSWARLIAASGMLAVAYSNREPVADLHAVLRHVDADSIAVWASSGNAPLALSLLMNDAPVRIARAALCYPMLFGVAEAARMFHFANPCEGRGAGDLRDDVPLFVARGGRDEFPAVNGSIDRFVPKALERNLPLTLVNHPEGPHAFDLVHDSDATRRVVEQLLAFLQSGVGPRPSR